MIDIAKSYQKRCMKTTDDNIGGSIFSVTLYALDKQNKFFCLNRRRKTDYYEAGVCANQNKQGTRRCTQQMIDNVLRGKNVTDSKAKIPIMCW